MSIRRFAMTCGPLAGLALALALPTSASAQSYGSIPAAPHVGIPGAPALPGTPDMRPVWQGASASMMPDSRARDSWLNECHRRTASNYGDHHNRRRHRNDSRRDDRAYSYCESYFDDYYRSYAERSREYSRAQTYVPVAQPARENCVETVTTEYVPIRTRVIPRRPAPRRVVPDKRVRDKRMLMD